MLFKDALMAEYDHLIDLRNVEYSTDSLVEMVKDLSPEWYEKVMGNLKKKLSVTESKLLKMKPSFVLDHFYGLDYVLAPAGVESKTRFGFDVTVGSSTAVFNKMRRADQMKPLWNAAGIQKVGIVVLDIDDSIVFDSSILGKARLLELGELIMIEVIFTLEDSNQTLSRFTVSPSWGRP